MSPDKSILEVLLHVTDISNNRKLKFEEKLNMILLEIIGSVHVKKGSVMLLKNKKQLEVVASTNPSIIGVTQDISTDSPSSWVFKNKKPLYVDSASQCDVTIGRFKHYKGDAFFLVPIISNDRSIGVLNVTDKIGTDRFNHDERKLLLHIVGHVITALENNRLAESLKKNQKILKKKNLELQKLEKLRTELFNMLIHDLKGPITEIVANLDILSYTITDENLEFVETAKNGCNTLFSMISNLLDISRLEEGKLGLVIEEINPQVLIRESLARLLVSVRSKELTFNHQFPASPGTSFYGDRSLLVRVLPNFIINAIEYSPRGECITIGYDSRSDEEITFFVQDNGPGIPESFRNTIFDKYTQLSKRADGRLYTAGLGLAFCKMAVLAHGGSIGVSSDGHRGSTFFFTISLKR